MPNTQVKYPEAHGTSTYQCFTIVKTIAGFLNTNGGELLIGVNDKGQILGLEQDYLSLKKKNRDGCFSP